MIFINVVFRFLNFLVLMAVFYYGIKRFMIPAVLKMIAMYDQFILNLKNERQIVAVECQSISEKTDLQELKFESIQTKFLLWEKKCEDQKVVRVVELQKVEKNIHNRFDIRSQVVMNELAIKEQLPYILDRVTQQLQVKYHEAESQKKYTEDLIHVMKELS